MGEAKRREKQAIIKRMEPMLSTRQVGEYTCSGILNPAPHPMGS